MKKSTILAPVLALYSAGCLASKGDIRLLQDDLTSMRAQQAQQALAQEQARARDDSLARVRLDSAIASITDVRDSLRALSVRTTNYQANASQALYDLGQQLITLQNRAGISQRQLQDLAAQLESSRAGMSGTGAGAAGGAASDTSAAQGPGPAELFKSARDQYENGAYATARMAFQQLLQQYPNYLDAGAATNYVGQTYEAEGNGAAADSVYQTVVTKYPQSPEAATALYKHAQWLIKSGKIDEARAALQRVVKDYPGSTAASLAADRLKTLPTH
ncbi:MAG: tetratricopeptide repeat protein [Gemmatimonadota bacterium]|nr:tetratricopeptide repeat protein [Gemmatimonadota bacterium]HEU4989032.1 tetratricopeptide repeat protein [Gemmatimonadaceae bacterium]